MSYQSASPSSLEFDKKSSSEERKVELSFDEFFIPSPLVVNVERKL